MDRTGAHGAQTWRIFITAGGFFLIIGFLLFTEHRAHVRRKS